MRSYIRYAILSIILVCTVTSCAFFLTKQQHTDKTAASTESVLAAANDVSPSQNETSNLAESGSGEDTVFENAKPTDEAKILANERVDSETSALQKGKSKNTLEANASMEKAGVSTENVIMSTENTGQHDPKGKDDRGEAKKESIPSGAETVGEAKKESGSYLKQNSRKKIDSYRSDKPDTGSSNSKNPNGPDLKSSNPKNPKAPEPDVPNPKNPNSSNPKNPKPDSSNPKNPKAPEPDSPNSKNPKTPESDSPNPKKPKTPESDSPNPKNPITPDTNSDRPENPALQTGYIVLNEHCDANGDLRYSRGERVELEKEVLIGRKVNGENSGTPVRVTWKDFPSQQGAMENAKNGIAGNYRFIVETEEEFYLQDVSHKKLEFAVTIIIE